MEKITICIIDKDESYKAALMEFMKSYCRNYLVNIPEIGDASKSDIKEIILNNDILLISYEYLETFKKASIEVLNNKAIILLESFSKWDEKNTTGFNIVSKYTDIKKIIKYIDNHYYELNPKSSGESDSMTRLILCLGLSGGSGTSSVAGGIAAELSKYRGMRVFYLSLDQFEPESDSASETSHERIIYSLINNNFSNKNKIIENNMIETEEGVWRMPVSKHKNVFHELELPEKVLYINEISDNNKFDYIVIDGGNRLDKFTEHLVGEADEIIIVDSHKSIKKNFMPGMLAYINEIKLTKNECKVMENFVDENSVQTYANAIPIKKYPMTGDNNIINNLGFGADIRRAVDYLG